LKNNKEYRRINVLAAAYACNPNRGSEEAVGWNWVQSIAATYQITVITASFHQADIASVCDIDANPRFVFVPHRRGHYSPTPFWRAIESSIAKPIMNLAYARWQRDAYCMARDLLKTQSFDLVHQLTYVGFRFPGHLWRLDLPFVWGPIGGLENTPWQLLPAMGLHGAAYYAGRNIINSAQRRWLRSPRYAIDAAGPGLIAATQGIARELRRTYGAASTIISEVVAPLELSPPAPRTRTAGEPLRIVWSGLHLPGKALNLLLKAMARLEGNAHLQLHILGDGPLSKEWGALARKLGIDNRCIWHGMIARGDALRVMSEAHVLAITSLKDLTSTVLLEGLSLGLPVICPDHCGFSDVVTDACGIKVGIDSIETLIAGMQSGLARLECDEHARFRMATAALDRAKAFSLAAKREKLEAVYHEVLSGTRKMVSE
jgi:glycosyltransferase involved in cell wall biosynthesis